ncbi:MAG: HAMP domain-containing histidine kinase, partial [Alphaproteobacteria bacterium]|nr:HAMP domain-containing histidine kinase [Alphaproteobacteria bacterium]
LEALIGRTPRTAFISDETPREVLERIADALNHGRRIRAEMVLRHSDGRTVWVELDAAPMFGDDGRLESIVGLHTDIGQRKRQEGELKRSLAEARELNDQQRQFISIASHEFRTPLAVIDGAAQRIAASLDTAEVNDSITQRLHRIRSAIGRMNGMIELMLSSARLDAGQLDVKTGWIDLGALLHDACERQRQISPLFAIDTDGIASGIRVEADARLLDQVIANLLSNAVKYSGASRRIEVALRCVAGGVETTVRDFGLGIAAQDLPRMFTRFYRAGTSTGIPGTGIGLHFTREIVLLHGGSIDLASDLGRGTTFFVRLPVTQPRIDGASAAAS